MIVRGLKHAQFLPEYNELDDREKKAIMISYYSKSKECHLKGFNTESRKNITLSQMQEQKVRNYCEQAAIKTGMEGLCRCSNSSLEFAFCGRIQSIADLTTQGNPNFSITLSTFGKTSPFDRKETIEEDRAVWPLRINIRKMFSK